MKRPLFLSLVALLLLGTVAETAYRAGRNAELHAAAHTITLPEPDPAPTATPGMVSFPGFSPEPVGSVMELPDMLPTETWVAALPSGRQYHQPGCPYALGGALIRISEARKQGYKPCPECSTW